MDTPHEETALLMCQCGSRAFVEAFVFHERFPYREMLGKPLVQCIFCAVRYEFNAGHRGPAGEWVQVNHPGDL